MTEPRFDVHHNRPGDPPDQQSQPAPDPTAGFDLPPGSTFDDQQTSSYVPPPETRATWAPPDWAVQTPPHWFEPLPDQQSSPKTRGGIGVVTLFVVALVAAVLGSLGTYAALLATNRLGEPVANLGSPAPTAAAAEPTAAAAATATPLPPANATITEAARRVSPAVVTITVSSAQPTDPNTLPETGVGSGIVFDSGGYILTNRHVVTDAAEVSVELNDGRTLPGTVYGIDTLTDLAIVKIEASDLPAAPIGDSAALQPGQTAVVIGSPLGTFTNSVTSGVISALGRSLPVTDPVTGQQRRLRNLIQTDAAINPGNSGGPLVNTNGEVIGVSTAYAQGAQGIFFAIPINIAKPIMAQAVAGEQLSRPWLGITYQAVDRNVADENQLPVDYGAWIAPQTGDGSSPIVPNSPAEQAGLQPGDIITSIDGHRIDATTGLDDVLSLFKPDQTLTLEVLRNGESMSIPITLGTRPAGLD